MTIPVDYPTSVEPVLEVTLIGRSDYAAWEPLIRAQGLTVEAVQDGVQLVLSAVQARYKGIPFREFSISLQLNAQQCYLIHAYNSRRFFAFAERRMFRTPYYFADIAVSERQIQVRQHGHTLFAASLPDSAAVTRQRYETTGWQIWLPRALRRYSERPHYFHALLEGDTRCYDVSTASLSAAADSPLNGAPFRLTDWLIRPAARHSKSATIDAEYFG